MSLKLSRTTVGQRDELSEWLTCLLRVLLMMLDDYVWCSIDSTSLRLPRRLNLFIVAFHLMFTPVGMVTWVDVGGGCYRVVLEHGSPLGLDGRCVLVMYSFQFHVC